MKRWLIAVLGLMAIATAPAAAGAPPPRTEFLGVVPPSVSATFGGNGDGLMTARGLQGTAPVWAPIWQKCDAAGEECQPFGAGESIAVGGASAGTRFKALGEGGAFALSPVWNGPLALHAPPRVHGAVRSNQLVTPVPAVWSGGWTTDLAETGLSACPTQAGIGCIVLAESSLGDCGGASVIDPDFTGWYLRVASSVTTPDQAIADSGRLPGYAEGTWRAGPTTAVAALGRIAPAKDRRSSSCGPPPLVPGLPPREALNVAHAEIATDGLAIVKCKSYCGVAERAAARHRHVTAQAGGSGEIELRVPAGELARLGRGPIRYTLLIDGRPVEHRTIAR